MHSMSLQPDGRVLIGGVFDTVNGASRRNLARLNGDLVLFETTSEGPSFATRVTTVKGRTYWLERRDSLDGGEWFAVSSVVGDGSIMALADSKANDWKRFYRVRVE